MMNRRASNPLACLALLPLLLGGAAGLRAAEKGQVFTPAPLPSLPASITGALPRSSPTLPAPATPAATEKSGEPAEPTEHATPGPETAGPEKSAPSLDQQSLAREKIAGQMTALLKLAQRAAAKGDTAAAEADFTKLLSLPAPPTDKRAALKQMGAFYADLKQYAKAAAVDEKILATFPDDPENPALYFELGRIYRAAGLYDLAISRFYSVLNAAISQADLKAGTKPTRNLSFLAQFEIAEASYAKGDYAAATKFYSRLERLEMPEADKPTVTFKNAQSLFQLANYQAAAAALRGFVDTFPASPFVPEARNLLARSFQKLKRPDDATDAVLALLRQEKKANDPANLARWQRETGRQVAARFYEDGDARSALTIYQTLATLDPAPDWQWPIVYQIGLCFERLGLPDRAREAYAFVWRPQSGHTDPAEDKLAPGLDAIRGMAKWREEHLTWAQNSGTQLQALLGPLRKGADAALPEGETATSPAPAVAPGGHPGETPAHPATTAARPH